MKKFLSTLAITAALVLPGVASADTVSDRSAAIQLCRAEVAAQTGAEPARIELDQVNVRPRAVRVDFDLWTDGPLQNIRCEVTRGAELTIASISPSLQTASAR